MRSVRKTIFLAVLATALIGQGALLAGCNTTEGFGKDVKSTGNAIEDGARNAKQ